LPASVTGVRASTFASAGARQSAPLKALPVPAGLRILEKQTEDAILLRLVAIHWL
jgi:hypothetical protein